MPGASSPARDNDAWLAGFLCLTGIFITLIIAGPLLDTYGVPYSGMGGMFLAKLHPGTYFIYLSFAVLVVRRGNPFGELLITYRRCRVYFSLLVLLALILLYMLLRDGAGGLAFFLDTHMAAAISAIVLSIMPQRMCRTMVKWFLAIALLNSVIGIGEALVHARLFTYKPDWNVIKEEIFRSSALRGHPLSNAIFTAVTIFIMLSQRYSSFAKTAMLTVFMLSMVAFAGRASLALTLTGLIILGLITVTRRLVSRNMTLQQTFMTLAATLAVPIILIGGFYVVLNSNLGESLAARAKWDDSASSREVVFQVFDYMTTTDIIFGVSSERILEISGHMKGAYNFAYIENPWLMMFMQLGGIAFFFWFIGVMAFAWRIVRGQPLPLKMAIIIYFLAASTFNSFAVKDSTYMLIMVAALCAGRALQLNEQPARFRPKPFVDPYPAGPGPQPFAFGR